MMNNEPDKARSLRIESAKVDEILNTMDGSRMPGKSGRGIRANRRIYDLKVSLMQPGGSRIDFVVVTRNLASQGVAFLHRNYVHVGSKFESALPTLDGGAIIGVRGTVVRCRHVVNMIHEVAVRFDEPIDLPNFASLTPEDEQACWTEVEMRGGKRGAGATEVGTALVVDDDKSQRAIAQVWFKRLGFHAVEAATGADALRIVSNQQIDVVLLDMMLGNESGLEVCKLIRAAKYFGLIVAASAETDDELRRQALTVGCDTFVLKPLTARNINQAIESVTSNAGKLQTEPVRSSLDQDEAVRPLVVEFADQLPMVIDQLAQALAASSVDSLKSICKSLKANGGSLGFWQITQAAEAAIVCLSASAKLEESQKQISGLLQLLRRVTVPELAPAAAEEPAPPSKKKK